jgi:hypothetical protein
MEVNCYEKLENFSQAKETEEEKKKGGTMG